MESDGGSLTSMSFSTTVGADDAVEDAVLKKDMVVRARARGARTGDSRLPFQPWRLLLAMCAVDALAIPRVGRAHLLATSPHDIIIHPLRH